MSEDELVVAFAEFARARGCIVLTAAANQISSFSFVVSKGKRKAPDIVLVRDDLLMLFEAKTSARDLTLPRKGELSDVASLGELLGVSTEITKVIGEAQRRMRATFGLAPGSLRLAAGVVACDPIDALVETLAEKAIAGISMSTVGEPPLIEFDPSGLAAQLLR